MTTAKDCIYPDCLIPVKGFGMCCEHSCPRADLAKELRRLASEPPEASFTNVEDLLAWLNDDDSSTGQVAPEKRR